ncbi:hypothetical protein [Hypnocyclicus thermotrophus]|nr:hypothetical protein [Hypnocyclicus thermotrophus]
MQIKAYIIHVQGNKEREEYILDGNIEELNYEFYTKFIYLFR